ncbi:MAG: class I tRNA ligase family protein, partial [Arachnia sp.]
IEWARRNGDPESWRTFWNSETAESYYFMGKDNIVFHSVIWPGIMLGANGQGAVGGEVHEALGELQLPTEVVSSEFLTMKGSKVATSRGASIFVGDFLKEFGPDALRFYIAVAGPENQDTDFTWDEFIRRINYELANEWGNLVNRSLSMAHKQVGVIPERGELTFEDGQLLDASSNAFVTVGDHIAARRFKAGITEAMRIVGLANKYLSDQEPWKLKEDPERRDTVLHVALQAISDCNTLLTPFLPHSAQKIFEALGGEGVWAAQPELVEVTDGDLTYPILQGDYASEQARWAPRMIVAGTPLEKPTPLFTKLDEALGATGPSWAPIATE